MNEKSYISSKAFYENLYRYGIRYNPASEIYNQLRVEYIKEMVSKSQGPNLIVGCGSHLDFQIFSSDTNTFLFDLSFEAIRSSPEGNFLKFVADIKNIPFASGYFNTVVCSEVLEHVQEVRLAVMELRAVLESGGSLIVSSPNWLSWFGLARWLGEKIVRHPLHSDNQPYDDWKTIRKFKAELKPEFDVLSARGVWFLPPLHYGRRGLPRWSVRLLYKIYAPIEALLSRVLPTWGHILILKCRPSVSNRSSILRDL